MYFVYVLQNPQGMLYKGYTSNLEERLRYHENGWNEWTKNKGPWQLVYREEIETKTEALKREKFLKSGQGREFLKKIIAG